VAQRFDQIVIENKKKEKSAKQRNVYIDLHLTDGFRNVIHSLLSRADARGSADIIYRMWRISLFFVRHGRIITLTLRVRHC